MGNDEDSEMVDNQQEETKEEQQEDRAMLEAQGIDLPEVFNKMLSPKSEETDADITRDLKLTNIDDAQTEFIFRLKSLMNLCKAEGLPVFHFYKSMHDYYVNARAAHKGFTAENIVSTRNFLVKKNLTNQQKRGWFR